MPYVSLSPLFPPMLRIRVFSLSTSSSSLLLSVLKFSCSLPLASTQAAAWLLSPPILLIRFSLDNLRKRAPLSSSPLHHSLCHPTTGFICWRRLTFDTSTSQAGLPLSPAQALFLVARGTERVFNEIQTLGMRSHGHLRTLLPLTSVATCGDQKTLSQAAKRNVAPLCECTMMMRNNGRFRREPRFFEGLKYSC